ncbi:MAG TPA: Fe-S cluster assembly protein SufD [Bauldia sp.]|nr:Fe-S cluster assembly protein SufD [Bauldia sp.]
MTAEVRTVRTPAEQAIVEHFETALPALPGGARVRQAREKAFAAFRKTGLPHRRVEEWKYTDLRALMKRAEAPAPRPSADQAARAAATPDLLPGVDRYRLTLVDGYFFPALSDVDALEKAGVQFASLAGLLAADNEMSAHMLTHALLASDDTALVLNTAFATDGVAIRIAPGAMLGKPIEIAHVSTGGASAARHALDVGEDANLRLIETHRGAAGAAYQANVAWGGMIGQGATVSFAKVQMDAPDAIHLGTTMLGIGEGVALNHLTLTAGAAVSRSQMFLSTGGDHTRLGLYGANMIGGRQHADTTLLIDHALPGANTRVLVKSAIDDEAQGVFQGKIVVEPDAQKTDAKMMSKALLLSETAEFDAKPELEIFADDVQCGHGATSGRIDAEQLFYLMARAVPRAEAERLLIEAFLDDAIDALGDEGLAPSLRGIVSDWLAKRGTRTP